MKINLISLLLVILAVSLNACAIGLGKSVHQYSLNERVEAKDRRTREIEAYTEQEVILATSNTYFADQAYQDLIKECPKGKIVNIVARHSTDLGILAFKNKMLLTATCIE